MKGGSAPCPRIWPSWFRVLLHSSIPYSLRHMGHGFNSIYQLSTHPSFMCCDKTENAGLAVYDADSASSFYIQLFTSVLHSLVFKSLFSLCYSVACVLHMV